MGTFLNIPLKIERTPSTSSAGRGYNETVCGENKGSVSESVGR